MRVPITYFMSLIENELLPSDITWRDIIDRFDDCAEFIELLKQDRLGNLLQPNSPYEGNLVASKLIYISCLWERPVTILAH